MNMGMGIRDVKSNRLFKWGVMLNKEFKASSFIMSGIAKVLLHPLRSPKTSSASQASVRKDIPSFQGDMLVLGPKVGIEPLNSSKRFGANMTLVRLFARHQSSIRFVQGHTLESTLIVNVIVALNSVEDCMFLCQVNPDGLPDTSRFFGINTGEPGEQALGPCR